MTTSSQRILIRWVHLFVGSIMATYIYSPWGENPLFQLIIKVLVIPVTAITGLWLWKGHLVRKYISKPGKSISIILFLVQLSLSPIYAQSVQLNTAPNVTRSQNWGAEISPVGAGVFRLLQAKMTYCFHAQNQFKSELGLGFLLQPESEAKTSKTFNKDGLYSAFMASIAYRQYIWKGLHLEEVANFGNGRIRNNKVDGKNYNAFVVFNQTFIGYKLNLIQRKKMIFFIIGQGGIGYVPLNTNQWPRTNNTSIYGLGDLKIGFNF
ncbi:MAG: hypothetical protein NW218_09355 [Saprospiraceae bacterium]|nr:hypothetical protein [Saprospiraceae bacterium]